MSLDDKGHDFEVVQTYLDVETVVCRRCSMRFVRDKTTKKAVPYQIEEVFGRWPCDEFNDLTIVAEIMES
jgi:hypothetical protein